MKKPFRLQLEAKKHRLKRRAGEVLREIGRAILLTGAIAVVTAVLLIGYDWIIRSPYLAHPGDRRSGMQGADRKGDPDPGRHPPVGEHPDASTRTPSPGGSGRIPGSGRSSSGGNSPTGWSSWSGSGRRSPFSSGREGSTSSTATGQPFKKLEPGDEANLPVLTGCVSGGRTNEALVKKSLALLNYLAGSRIPPPSARYRRSTETRPSGSPCSPIRASACSWASTVMKASSNG